MDRHCTQCGAEVTSEMKFCSQCGASLAEQVAPAAPPRRAAERRQLTVIFADVAGYTEIASSLDPEDLQSLISDYHQMCRQAVEDAGGIVAEYLGDGIVAYFGYPVAREDAARQAVQASLDIVSGIEGVTVEKGPPLRVRVGVATGLVVAQSLGNAEEGPRIFGEVPTMAARLQGLAPLNSVLINEDTYRLVRNNFAFSDMLELEPKGFRTPVSAWIVLDQASASETGAVQTRQMTGRAGALATLRETWQSLESGKGQAVLVVGEPGIGKSRLGTAFREEVAPPDRIIIAQASPIYQNTAFYPTIRILERVAAGAVTEIDDPAARFAAFADVLRGHVPEMSNTSAGLLGSLIGIADPAAPVGETLPQRRRVEVVNAVVEFVVGLTKNGPLCVLLEDLHWLDASSIEVLQGLMSAKTDVPLLILATTRPEGSGMEAMAGLGAVRLDLDRLDAEASADLVNDLAGTRVSPSVRQAIVERADGVPLFLEELTNTVLEEGRDAYEGNLAGIPVTLRDSLATRLDRTGEAKEYALLGSVAGRRFNAAYVAALSGETEDQVHRRLSVFVDAGLMFRQGDNDYNFKHALIRDAAYESILRRRRRDLHNTLAEWLAARADETRPEEIALHFDGADRTLEAVPYWLSAGYSALGQAAFAEAEGHIRNGINGLADRDQEDVSVKSAQASLLAMLGATLMQTKGFSAPDVHQAYSEAYEIVSTLQDADDQYVPVLWGFYSIQLIGGNMPNGYKLACEFSEFAEKLDNIVLKVAASSAMCASLFYSGRPKDVLRHAEYLRENYSLERERPFAALYSVDVLPKGLLFKAHSHWMRGDIKSMRETIAETDAHGEIANLPLMKPWIDIFGSVPMIYAGDYDEALLRLERGIELADQQGFVYWAVIGRAWAAVAQLEKGNYQECLAALPDQLMFMGLIGNGVGVPYFQAMQARALWLSGDREQALSLAEEAVSLSETQGDGAWRSEIFRVFGEILAESGDIDAAHVKFDLATAYAQDQGAKTWEFRAAISRARYAKPGDQGQAKESLGALVESAKFTDIRDYGVAKALLEAA